MSSTGVLQFLNRFIAVCIYRLVMISIDLSETTQKVHWKSETKFRDNVQDKIQSEKKSKNFYWKKILLGKKISDFVSD